MKGDPLQLQQDCGYLIYYEFSQNIKALFLAGIITSTEMSHIKHELSAKASYEKWNQSFLTGLCQSIIILK